MCIFFCKKIPHVNYNMGENTVQSKKIIATFKAGLNVAFNMELVAGLEPATC